MTEQKIAPVLSDVRHQFEEWLITEHGLDAEWDPERNCYKEFGIHLAWQAVLDRVGADAVPALDVAGALFDFLGFLTTLDEAVSIGSACDAALPCELLNQWADKRGLILDEANVFTWHRHIRALKGTPAAAPANEHIDDDAVDAFAVAMKDKLADARRKGRSRWFECDPADLSRMLREHVEKGDPRDVANFCMFLWSLGHPITPADAMADAQPVAWMADDGRVANAESRAGMHAITQASYCIPLYAAPQPSSNPGPLAAVTRVRLPKLPEELYEHYVSMSAQTHEAQVKAYARAAIAASKEGAAS